MLRSLNFTAFCNSTKHIVSNGLFCYRLSTSTLGESSQRTWNAARMGKHKKSKQVPPDHLGAVQRGAQGLRGPGGVAGPGHAVVGCSGLQTRAQPDFLALFIRFCLNNQCVFGQPLRQSLAMVQSLFKLVQVG